LQEAQWKLRVIQISGKASSLGLITPEGLRIYRKAYLELRSWEWRPTESRRGREPYWKWHVLRMMRLSLIKHMYS